MATMQETLIDIIGNLDAASRDWTLFPPDNPTDKCLCEQLRALTLICGQLLQRLETVEQRLNIESED
jgi:hypothetical protein